MEEKNSCTALRKKKREMRREKITLQSIWKGKNIDPAHQVSGKKFLADQKSPTPPPLKS